MAFIGGKEVKVQVAGVAESSCGLVEGLVEGKDRRKRKTVAHKSVATDSRERFEEKGDWRVGESSGASGATLKRGTGGAFATGGREKCGGIGDGHGGGVKCGATDLGRMKRGGVAVGIGGGWKDDSNDLATNLVQGRKQRRRKLLLTNGTLQREVGQLRRSGKMGSGFCGLGMC